MGKSLDLPLEASELQDGFLSLNGLSWFLSSGGVYPRCQGWSFVSISVSKGRLADQDGLV
jgi:hypothetical protein